MATKNMSDAVGLSHLEQQSQQPLDQKIPAHETIDKAELEQLLRKIDLRVIPILTILYLLSFLDRGSIGNANILGLSEDLKLVGNQYNWALTIFFFPYCFFEPICNLLLVRFKPSRWLPSIMVAWGIVTVLTGIVHNYAGLMCARFFLGLTEGGLFPGIAFYMSLWYPRVNAQFRLSMVFASASLAGGFSGLLAYLIGKMDGVGHLAGWRWIFILEGLLTVVVAILAFFLVVDEPSTASFLSDREKYVLHAAMNSPGTEIIPAQQTSMGNEDGMNWKHALAALKDWQTIFHCIGYWGNVCAVYAVSFFLPTIINGLGYSAATAQLMTIPVYAAATVACLLVGYFSDRTGNRGIYVIVCYMLVFVGFLIAVAPSKFIPGLTYAGCFIASCGSYPGVPGLLALASNNYAPYTKRAVGMAMQIGIGSMGGAAVSNFYHKEDGPRYRLGHGLVMAFAAIGTINMVIYYILCRRSNAKRDTAGLGDREYTDQELYELGDKAPGFRYTL